MSHCGVIRGMLKGKFLWVKADVLNVRRDETS